MDPEKLRAYLENDCTRDARTGRVVSKRTGGPVTAVIPVHLYGQMADMDPILELAARYDLMVIEDACQAQGAEYLSGKEGRWRKAGSMGQRGGVQLLSGQEPGGLRRGGGGHHGRRGDGAAVPDAPRPRPVEEVLPRHRGVQRAARRDPGGHPAGEAPASGEVERAAAGARASATTSCSRTAEGAVVLPHVPAWSRPVYHLYVVRVADRERVQQELAAAGIGTGIHYPIPLHLLKAYEALGFRPGDFPVAEQAASQVLSLPMFPGLSPEQQERVVRCVVEATKATDGPRQVAEPARGSRR